MNKLINADNLTRRLSVLIYIFIWSIGVVMGFYPTLLSHFSNIQTDPGDQRLLNYFLEHSFQLLVNRDYIGELWSPTFFYPYKNVLTFSENIFGSAPIYWLFRSLFMPEMAYQLWMIAVSILNFISFAILMRRFQINHILSGLGAFLFAFSMPRIVKLGHSQLLPQFFTPLAFIAGWEFIKQPTRKRLILLLLLTYLQILAGIYLGWFLLFSLVIFFSISYGFFSEERTKFLTYWRNDYRAIIAIIIGWISLTIVTLFPYLQALSVFGKRSYGEVDTMLPRISSWFATAPGSIWSSLLSWTSKDLPMVHEHIMFMGFTTIFMTGLSLYIIFYFKHVLTPERYWLIKVCFLVFFTIFLLSLRLPFGLSLWRIIYEVVPGASIIRAVARIWTISYLYLLVAVILSFDSLINAVITSKRLRLLIVSMICIIGISEQIMFNLPSYEKEPYIKEKTELSQLMEQDCDLAYLSWNPEKPFYLDNLTAMWAGIKANVPVINGYSGNVPPNYGDPFKPMNTAQIINWLESFPENNNKQLCVISHSSLTEQDPLINRYAVHDKNTLSASFISYKIKLPIPQEFSQDIKFLEIPKLVEAKSVLKVPVWVRNTSNFLWYAQGKNPTNFSYRWIDSNGQLTAFDGDGDRTPLTFPISPGESIALNAVIRTPPTPGKYKLILTMVQEAVAWFNDKTPNFTEIDIEVVSKQS